MSSVGIPYHHTFYFDSLPNGRYSQYTEWCKENLGPRGQEWDWNTIYLTFEFRDPMDATAFKLRFGL